MFDLYFVGSQNIAHDKYMVQKSASRLFSYAEKPYSKLKLYENTNCKMFIDSGAFSIARNVKRSKGLNIDSYIEFVNKYTKPDLYASFDVIPFPNLNTETAIQSAKESWNNYIYMLEKVNEPDKLLPVYHYGEPLEYLEQILDGHNGYKPKYMAFGGRAGVSTKNLYPCLDKFFAIIKDKYPSIKVHAFGVTVFDILESYPFTSADSTSYQKVATMGGIFLECINGVIKISTNTITDNNHFNYVDEYKKQLVLNEIIKYGYTLQDLQTSTNKRIEFNVDYFMRWQNNYKYKPRQKTIRKPLF